MVKILKKTKLRRCVRGSVCIFLSLVMLPVMTAGGMLTDGAKIQAAKLSISGAAGLSCEAALSYFDRTLWDMYGLFALSEGMDDLEENVSKYFTETLEGYGFADYGDAYTREFINSFFGALRSDTCTTDKILKIASETFSLSGIPSCVIANPSVLENQIIEYMKYRAPVELGEGILSKIGCISEISAQTNAAEKKLVCESGLGEIENCAAKAYTAICMYNSSMEKSRCSRSADSDSDVDIFDIFGEDIELFAEYCRVMSMCIMAETCVPDNETAGIVTLGDLCTACGKICSDDLSEFISMPIGEASSALFGKACGIMYDGWYVPLSAALTYLDEAISALDEMLVLLEEFRADMEKWKKSIDALSDGSVKTSMYIDYDSTAEKSDAEAVMALADALEKRAQALKKINQCIESTSYYGKNTVSGSTSGKKYISLYEFISEQITDRYAQPGDVMVSAEDSVGQYLKLAYPGEKSGICSAFITGSDTQTAFYSELKKICSAKASAETEENGSDIKKSLLSFASENSAAATLSEDIPDSVSGNISTDILSRIEELSGYSDVKKETFKNEIYPDDSDDETVSNASTMLGNISNLLENLKNIGECARDDLYVEEYISGMFSCFTDTLEGDNAVNSLSGNSMSANPLFGSEIEYILWGNDSPSGNIASTEALIFGIRFALNTVYAMTASETRSAALTAATAIAGWTGFAVPVVENVILVSWALAESALDLQLLIQGKSVAVYKSSSTWKLGLGGAKQIAIEAAAAIVSESVDDIFDVIDEKLIDAGGGCVDEAEELIEEYIESCTENIYEQVQSALAVTVEGLATSVAASADRYGIADISAKAGSAFIKLKGSRNGIVGECIDCAVDMIISDELQNISADLYDLCCATSNAENMNEFINEKLYGTDGIIETLKTKIYSAVCEKIEAYADDCREDISNTIKNATGNIKSEVKERLSDFIEGISGKEEKEQTVGVETGSVLSMNYREYLKLFILMNYAVSGTSMLKRMSEIIQINVSADEESENFDITGAYTAISCFASGKISTLFLGSYRKNSVSSFYSKTQNITYTDVYGY